MDFLELCRKINVLWELANICPQCQKTQLQITGDACYPPNYFCPYCQTRSNAKKSSPNRNETQNSNKETHSDEECTLEGLFD